MIKKIHFSPPQAIREGTYEIRHGSPVQAGVVTLFAEVGEEAAGFAKFAYRDLSKCNALIKQRSGRRFQ